MKKSLVLIALSLFTLSAHAEDDRAYMTCKSATLQSNSLYAGYFSYGAEVLYNLKGEIYALKTSLNSGAKTNTLKKTEVTFRNEGRNFVSLLDKKTGEILMTYKHSVQKPFATTKIDTNYYVAMDCYFNY